MIDHIFESGCPKCPRSGQVVGHGTVDVEHVSIIISIFVLSLTVIMFLDKFLKKLKILYIFNVFMWRSSTKNQKEKP